MGLHTTRATRRPTERMRAVRPATQTAVAHGTSGAVRGQLAGMRARRAVRALHGYACACGVSPTTTQAIVRRSCLLWAPSALARSSIVTSCVYALMGIPRGEYCA